MPLLVCDQNWYTSTKLLTLIATMSFMLFKCLWLLMFFGLTTAQFAFFDQIFGHNQNQQQQTQSSSSQWASYAESGMFFRTLSSNKLSLRLSLFFLKAACSQYLCPDTLVCSARPMDCPCPHKEDTRCIIHDAQDRDDGTVLCIRGVNDCVGVEKLARKWI